MGMKRAQWILAAALLLAVNVLLMLASAADLVEWGELVIRGVETAVFLGLLGAAVRGVKGMDRRVWLGIAVMSAVDLPLELLSWHFWNGFVPAAFLRMAADVIFISAGELITCVLLMAAMSLLLHRDCLRQRGTRLRTFGRLEFRLCLTLLAVFIAAAILAQWCQTYFFMKRHQQMLQQMQNLDPLAILGTMLSMSTSSRMIWVDDVYRACRLLLKALCIWVTACGVLGFPAEAERRQGESNDHEL